MHSSCKITRWLGSVKASVQSFFTNRVKKKQATTTSPWQADLARLASQRREDISAPPPEVHLDEVTAFVNELAKSAKPKQAYTPPEPEQRRRRTADMTVTDLKTWWGDSVATWDPETDGKNVNSSDQRPHTRQAKWFNKYTNNKE